MGSRFPVRCGGTHDQEDQSWAHRPFRPRSMGGRRKAQSRGSCHTPDARDVLLSGVLDVQTQQIRPRSSMALRHARRWRRACDLPSRFLPASAVEPTLLAGPIRSALDGAPPSVDATGPTASRRPSSRLRIEVALQLVAERYDLLFRPVHDGCPIGGHAVFGPRCIVHRPGG